MFTICVRYLFWHWLLMSFGIEFGFILASIWYPNDVSPQSCFFDELFDWTAIDFWPKRKPTLVFIFIILSTKVLFTFVFVAPSIKLYLHAWTPRTCSNTRSMFFGSRTPRGVRNRWIVMHIPPSQRPSCSNQKHVTGVRTRSGCSNLSGAFSLS